MYAGSEGKELSLFAFTTKHRRGSKMAQDWAKRFYNSQAWKKQRDYVLKRDHYTCTEPGCRARAEEVHHIKELSANNVNDINISLNPSNLRSLCGDCHKRITREMKSGTFGILQDIVFDTNGYPVAAGEVVDSPGRVTQK